MTERRPLAITDGRQAEVGDGDTLPADLVPTELVAAKWTPTWIPEGTTYTIPTNTQLLTIAPVKCDGTVVIDGTLIIAEAGVCCGPTEPPPPLPPTEELFVNGYTILLGDPTPPDMSVIECLKDDSDATYIANAPGFPHPNIVEATFDDLVGDGGREIEQFVIYVRCVSDHSSEESQVGVFSGIAPTPSFSGHFAPTSVGTVQHGPFTRPGGGTWSASEFNSLVCTISLYSGFSVVNRMHRVSLVVTYAE